MKQLIRPGVYVVVSVQLEDYVPAGPIWAQLELNGPDHAFLTHCPLPASSRYVQRTALNYQLLQVTKSKFAYNWSCLTSFPIQIEAKPFITPAEPTELHTLIFWIVSPAAQGILNPKDLTAISSQFKNIIYNFFCGPVTKQSVNMYYSNRCTNESDRFEFANILLGLILPFYVKANNGKTELKLCKETSFLLWQHQ